MVSEAMLAADLLKDEGISAEVIDMFTVKPVDKDLIVKTAQEDRAVVTSKPQCDQWVWRHSSRLCLKKMLQFPSQTRCAGSLRLGWTGGAKKKCAGSRQKRLRRPVKSFEREKTIKMRLRILGGYL